MIIYGSNSKLLTSEIIPDKCSSCESHHTVKIQIFQKYASVYWIPFFPIRKLAFSQCSHCTQQLEKKHFPDRYLEKYERIKMNTRTPVWTFSGLTIVMVIILGFAVSGMVGSARTADYLNDPKVGDIYEIKWEEGQYTLIKVDNVIRDQVFFLAHKYETDMISGIQRLKNYGDAGFDQENFFDLKKEELKAMFEKGEILAIERK